MYLIGVDPSSQKENNGLAIWDTHAKKYITIRSMSLLSVIGEVKDFLDSFGVKSENGKGWTNVVIVVENAELDSPVFGAWKTYRAFLLAKIKQPFTFWENAAKTTFRKLMAQAQSIGMLKIACRIIVERLREFGVEVIEVAPSWRDSADQKGKSGKKKGGLTTKDPRYMIMPTKTTHEQFKILTSYSDKTNEHGRDAATLIHNQTLIRLRNWVRHHMLTSKSVPQQIKKRYQKEQGLIK